MLTASALRAGSPGWWTNPLIVPLSSPSGKSIYPSFQFSESGHSNQAVLYPATASALKRTE